MGARGAFPLSGLVAHGMARHRVALVGEAAHVMPPIGAQGLNLGFRDVADLVNALSAPPIPARPMCWPVTSAPGAAMSWRAPLLPTCSTAR